MLICRRYIGYTLSAPGCGRLFTVHVKSHTAHQYCSISVKHIDDVFAVPLSLGWWPSQSSRRQVSCFVKANFHFAIQVADLAFDKFVRVCDFFESKAGRRQVRAISTCRGSSNLVADRLAAGFRPAFDRPATRTRHAHAGLCPGLRPGLRPR